MWSCVFCRFFTRLLNLLVFDRSKGGALYPPLHIISPLPGNRAVTQPLTRSESINTLTLRTLSLGTWAMGDSSFALQPPSPASTSTWGCVPQSPAHIGSSAPVSQQALAFSQSVKQRQITKRQPEKHMDKVSQHFLCFYLVFKLYILSLPLDIPKKILWTLQR